MVSNSRVGSDYHFDHGMDAASKTACGRDAARPSFSFNALTPTQERRAAAGRDRAVEVWQVRCAAMVIGTTRDHKINTLVPKPGQNGQHLLQDT